MLVRHIGEYLAAMWADWVSRMSGLASLLIAFLAAYYQLIERGKPALWVAAAITYLIASFSVWRKNQPDLSVESEGIFLDSGVSGLEEKGAYLTIKLLLVNTRMSNNAIKRFELFVVVDGLKRVGRLTPTDTIIQKSEGDGHIDLNKFKHSPLPQGWPKDGWVRFALDGLSVEHVRNKKLVLIVTDAYNIVHKIEAKTPQQPSNDIIRRPVH